MATTSIYAMNDTWNNVATTFAAIKMNVTDTASAAASKLLDLQVGGVSQFSVTKGSQVYGNNSLIYLGFNGTDYAKINAPDGFASQVGFSLTSSVYSASDIFLLREGAGILAQRNGVNAQSFRLYNTYTDAANYERAVFDWSTTANTLTIGTQKAGTGATRSIQFIRDGVSFLDYGISDYTGYSGLTVGVLGYLAAQNNIFSIGSGAASNMTFEFAAQNTVVMNAGVTFGWGSQENGTGTGLNLRASKDTAFSRTAAGVIALGNGTAGNKTGVLQLGGISYATPATKTAAYTATINDHDLIFNGAASITLTLPAAATYPGQEYYVKTIAAQTVVSATANIVPRAGGAATTALLAGVAGTWARIVSDGTNWVVMAGN